MKNDLKQLKKIMEIKSMKSQRALAEVQAEEADLRGKISTLMEHRRRSHDTDPMLMPMRTIRADVLWQAWIDRTQNDLNIDLARVLARKERVQRSAAQDIGKHQVAIKLNENAEKDRALEKAEADLSRALTYASLFSMRMSGR